MPAIVYGKAFVLGQDKRLLDTVNSIEATSPMVDMYVTGVDDVSRWCRAHLSGTALTNALAQINNFYGALYQP